MGEQTLAVNQSRVEMVFQAEYKKLWRALVAYSGQPELASDAASEAFAQLLARGDEVRDPAAWVWTAGFRIAAGELKRQAQPPPSLTLEGFQPSDALIDLIAALKTLSPNQRIAIVLHDYADRPVDEVSRLMRVSRATVYVHLSQGRGRLKRAIGERS